MILKCNDPKYFDELIIVPKACRDEKGRIMKGSFLPSGQNMPTLATKIKQLQNDMLDVLQQRFELSNGEYITQFQRVFEATYRTTPKDALKFLEKYTPQSESGNGSSDNRALNINISMPENVQLNT